MSRTFLEQGWAMVLQAFKRAVERLSDRDQQPS